MTEFGNALEFDYTDYSWASVKFFLDCLHLISAGPVDIAILLEVIDFCQFEGKTTYNSFELELVERIMTSIMKASLPIGTELLISAYLSRVDDFNDRYQLQVAEKLTEEAVSSLVFKFDIQNKLNKQLTAMCVQKGIFADESHESVLIRILMYGKELIAFQTENVEPDQAADENRETGHIFKPDPRSARYVSSSYRVHMYGKQGLSSTNQYNCTNSALKKFTS